MLATAFRTRTSILRREATPNKVNPKILARKLLGMNKSQTPTKRKNIVGVSVRSELTISAVNGCMATRSQHKRRGPLSLGSGKSRFAVQRRSATVEQSNSAFINSTA
jgi:hypothetical protein